MQLQLLLAKLPFVFEVNADRRPYLPQFAYHIADHLTERRPKGVKAVFAFSQRRLDRRILLPQLVTVASYRSAYSVIERMARVLTPAVIDLDVTPVIVPITERALEGMTTDSPLVTRLFQRGVRLTQ